MNTEVLRLMRFIKNLNTQYFKEINISRSQLYEIKRDTRLLYKSRLETVLKLYNYMHQHEELKHEQVKNVMDDEQFQIALEDEEENIKALNLDHYVGVDLGSKHLIAASNNDLSQTFIAKTQNINRLTNIYNRERKQAQRSEFKTLATTLCNKFTTQVEGEINYQVNQLLKEFDDDAIFVVGDQCFRNGQEVKDQTSSNYIIWSLIIKQFRRKLEDQNRLIIINESGSSIKCPNCHRSKKSNRTIDNRFHCKSCGFKHESDDVVAAVNILNKYLAKNMDKL